MTESEVPTLGLGAEQRQMWTQAVMTMAYGVRERRHALGRVAWSDEQTAERTHERTERIADPAVRAMSVDEWTEAVDRRQRGQGGERHTHSGDGWVTVWIGPLDGGRTALLASAGPPGSTTPTATAAVELRRHRHRGGARRRPARRRPGPGRPAARLRHAVRAAGRGGGQRRGRARTGTAGAHRGGGAAGVDRAAVHRAGRGRRGQPRVPGVGVAAARTRRTRLRRSPMSSAASTPTG